MHLVGRGQAVLREVNVHRVDPDGLRLAQVVERPVAGDPVEPRAYVDRPVVGLDCVEGGREDLLQHVFRVLPAVEHVPAEGEQARLVAAHEGLKGVVVAAADQRDEALVALEAHQRGAAMEAGDPGVLECGDFQERRRPRFQQRKPLPREQVAPFQGSRRLASAPALPG
jgi:hypothetical protein